MADLHPEYVAGVRAAAEICKDRIRICAECAQRWDPDTEIGRTCRNAVMEEILCLHRILALIGEPLPEVF